MTNAIKTIYDGVYTIPFSSWAYHPSSLPNGNKGELLEISCGKKYLKALIGSFRANDFLALANRSLSGRGKLTMTNYYWLINGKPFPPNHVDMLTDAELAAAGTGPPDDARGFMQVMKVFNNMPSTHATCSFSMKEFNSSGLVGSPTLAGAFVVGCNLKLPNGEEEYRTTTNAARNNVRFKFTLETGLAQTVFCDFYMWYSGEVLVDKNRTCTVND